MRQTIANYFVAISVQDVIMFALGGLFAGRIYGVAKRLYGHIEGAVGHLAGSGAAKK